MQYNFSNATLYKRLGHMRKFLLDYEVACIHAPVGLHFDVLRCSLSTLIAGGPLDTVLYLF